MKQLAKWTEDGFDVIGNVGTTIGGLMACVTPFAYAAKGVEYAKQFAMQAGILVGAGALGKAAAWGLGSIYTE